MIINDGSYLTKTENAELSEFYREHGLIRYHSMNAATNRCMYSEKRGFHYRDTLAYELWSYKTLVCVAHMVHDANTTRAYYRFDLTHAWNCYSSSTTRQILRFIKEFANVDGYVSASDVKNMCACGCNNVYKALYNRNNLYDAKLNVEITCNDSHDVYQIAKWYYERETRMCNEMGIDYDI